MSKQFLKVVSKNAKTTYNGKGVDLRITDNFGTEFSHRFSDQSRFFKQYIEADNKREFEKLYEGATFFFLRNNAGIHLIDFRNNHYKGFVQTTDVLEELADNLGVSQNEKGRIILGSQSFDYSFEAFDEGVNSFDAKISLPFNPFSSNVSCSVGLERLICLNGMITNTSVFDFKIPILNKVEDNLRVALSQIAPQVREKLKYHIESLQMQRASLSEAMRTFNFVHGRISSNESERKILENLAFASNVYVHCKNYDKEIFKNTSACKSLPSHLTRFDVWNILTELDSHTRESEASKSRAIQRYINTIMFDSATIDQKNERSIVIAESSSRFNASHKQAFFGK